jgi:hypothetical protein
VDAPIVDGTTGFVFAINGNDNTNHGTIIQASTDLSTSVVSFSIGGSGGNGDFSGAFDNTYINSSKPSIAGHMYVCGNSSVNQPGVYQLSFNASTGALTSVGTPFTGLSTSNAVCSPVTEFFNSSSSTDWIFFSIGDQANTANPIPSGSACRMDRHGCLLSINVTGNPTWPPTVASAGVSLPNGIGGSASGIIVDNASTGAQASSIYFSLLNNSLGSGPGLPSCNTTSGVGCAVKLTQSGLN